MVIKNIIATIVFDKDLKTLRKKHTPLTPLWDAVDAIVTENTDLLSSKYKDHALTGQWVGFRELHIKGDWLLIYRIDSNGLTLVLTRTNTHDVLYSARTTSKTINTYRKAIGHTINKQ